MRSRRAESVRILADENIPRSVLTWLRSEGHEVTSASEVGIGDPDTRWLTFAESERRSILTSDKDFGDTCFGIILLRLDDVAVAAWVTRLQEVWSVVEANPSGCFIVVTSKRVRVRPLK
jgi:predicted nuclease of predicted toxin-antitoxin system